MIYLNTSGIYNRNVKILKMHCLEFNVNYNVIQIMDDFNKMNLTMLSS